MPDFTVNDKGQILYKRKPIEKISLDNEEIFSDKPYYVAAIEELYKVEAMPLLSQAGLREPLGAENQLTAFTPIHDLHFPIPLFRLDHILHTEGVISSEIMVHREGIFEEASDHYPISCRIL